jgi:enoyl-CoA hydratase/carnithine racemase
MITFDTYHDRYPSVRMEREDGILELTFNTDGGSLMWGAGRRTHYDIAGAFNDISRDLENRIVITIGSGELHSGPRANDADYPILDAEGWDAMRFNSMHCLNSLLAIEAPVISCINGPVYRHAELALLGDIVLAAEGASVQDSAHFVRGQVPGDGSHIVFPYLLGPTRASYFLLTGQEISSRDLLNLGLVNEVMGRYELLGRARDLASVLARQNPLTLRHTRTLLTQPLRELVARQLGYGFALEGHAALVEAALRAQSQKNDVNRMQSVDMIRSS